MSESRLQKDVFNQLLSLVAKAGITQEKLPYQARINGLSASDSSISSDTEAVIFLSTAAELINDPYLGLRLGQQVGIASYGTFGFAIMSCANLRESIELLLRYGKVFFKPHWESENHNGGLLLWHNLTKGTPAQQRLIAELSFSQMSLIGNSLYRSRLKGAELQLIYSEPPDSAYYQSFFDIKVIFGAERNQLFLPEHVLDTPVKTANISNHVVFHQQCEEMLRSLSSAEKTTTEVRRLLLQSAGDFFDINQVAARLNMSERSLRRRLNAECVSFRTLVEEVRDLLAREYLAKTDLTVAEIAHLLSYSETVNFRRAFARWNGTTPTEYRLRWAKQFIS